MNILGIGGYSHDSAAALVCDGQLVAAAEEERFTRVKHQGGAPHRAAQYCLDAAGLTMDDVDHIGVYMKPGLRVRKRLAYRLARFPRNPAYSAAYMGYELAHNLRFVRDMRGMRGRKAQLHYMEHHPAHAASAFLVSPFEVAALLSVDYIGEWSSTWFGGGRGTEVSALGTVDYPHSLGVFYSAITDYRGFERANDEYKVMGLAPYGEPEFYDDFKRVVCDEGLDRYVIDLSWTRWHYLPGSRKGYFSDKFLERIGPARGKGEPIGQRHKNVAASAQKVLEDAVFRLAGHLARKTQSRNLCLAGGVALNCAMNGRLLRESAFENIYVQPASGDDGIAIGAAFQLWHRLSGKPREFVMEDARLGPEYDDAAVRSALEGASLEYETPERLEERAAELIADGKIVGWFQGRMEFGPRALGARSILADPTRVDMKDRVNATVKHREDFRPFAPACLEERACEFFEGCKKSPFMLFVHPVVAEYRDRLPAITHVDGTARVQTVSKEIQPRFYKVIEAFEARRGIPVVLNTSFNVMGEPIVNTPEEAVRCYQGTGFDALVIGDHVVVKDAA